MKQAEEPKIIDYKYAVESREAMLLVGKTYETAEDIPGWHIDLVKYEIWSDGDKVPCNKMTMTSTTDEKEVKYLMAVVKTSAVFALVFEKEISQTEALELFIKVEEI